MSQVSPAEYVDKAYLASLWPGLEEIKTNWGERHLSCLLCLLIEYPPEKRVLA